MNGWVGFCGLFGVCLLLGSFDDEKKNEGEKRPLTRGTRKNREGRKLTALKTC